MAADSGTEVFSLSLAESGLDRTVKFLKQESSLPAEIHADQGGGKLQGRPGIVGSAPVAQTQTDQAPGIGDGNDVVHIPPDLGEGFFDDFLPSGEAVYHIGQLNEDLIPGRADGVAPAVGGGDDAGHVAFVIQRLPDVPQPFIVVISSVKVQQGMFQRQGSVSGPSVLFPVRAVGGEVVEVGQGGNFRHPLELIDNLIRAMETAPAFKLGIHDPIGQQFSCGLFRGNAPDQSVAETVVGETGGPGLDIAALAGVLIFLDVQRHVQILGTDKPQIIHRETAIYLDVLAEDHADLLARLALDPQGGHAGAVFTKVVQIAGDLPVILLKG